MIDTTHLHPMIVHFPIALLIVGFLSELVGLILKKEFFTTAAFYLLILGTLGVVAAYITGNLAGDGISETGQLETALETHEHAAQLTLWLMVGAAAVRIALVWFKKFDGAFKYVAFLLFLVGVLSVARTGFYGGELVYKHAAGVQFNFGLDQNATGTEKANSEDNDD